MQAVLELVLYAMLRLRLICVNDVCAAFHARFERNNIPTDRLPYV